MWNLLVNLQSFFLRALLRKGVPPDERDNSSAQITAF